MYYYVHEFVIITKLIIDVCLITMGFTYYNLCLKYIALGHVLIYYIVNKIEIDYYL